MIWSGGKRGRSWGAICGVVPHPSTTAIQQNGHRPVYIQSRSVYECICERNGLTSDVYTVYVVGYRLHSGLGPVKNSQPEENIA